MSSETEIDDAFRRKAAEVAEKLDTVGRWHNDQMAANTYQGELLCGAAEIIWQLLRRTAERSK